jgi:hypothetical protein
MREIEFPAAGGRVADIDILAYHESFESCRRFTPSEADNLRLGVWTLWNQRIPSDQVPQQIKLRF